MSGPDQRKVSRRFTDRLLQPCDLGQHRDGSEYAHVSSMIQALTAGSGGTWAASHIIYRAARPDARLRACQLRDSLPEAGAS